MMALKNKPNVLQDLKDSIWVTKDLNFWLSRIHPLWSFTEALAQVVNKETVAKDTVCLTLKCNRHVKLGQAGQHHPVRVLIDGRQYERQYSLALHPSDKNHLQLTVKKVHGGKVSTYLCDQIEIGTLLSLGEPYGDMQLGQVENTVLLAAGSGITPMLSMLRQWSKTPKQPVTLLYWVKTQEDIAHRAELERLAAEHAAFTLKVLKTQEYPIQPRLNMNTFMELAMNLSQSTVFACGPAGFVKDAEEFSSKAQAFMGEAFSLPVAVANAERRMIEVTLLKQNKVVQIPSDQPILLGLEQADIQPTYGCRMGVCNKCSCPKVQGHIQNMLNGEQNAEPSTQIKLCINHAQSDLILDL